MWQCESGNIFPSPTDDENTSCVVSMPIFDFMAWPSFFFYLETNRETTIVIISTTTIIKARSCLNVRNNPNISVISGFRREADERCALRGYNAANSGKELPPYAAYNRGTHPVVPLEESHFPISCLLLFRNSVWWCRSVRMLYPCIFIVLHFFHN